MYCSSCGKKMNDTASFCPYCGAKKVETVRPVPTMGNIHVNEVLPVYKRKEKAAFLVAFVPLIGIFLRTVIMLALFMFQA